MTQQNKCRVCGGDTPVPFRFCWKCRDTRTTDCLLFEKSDRGELTAGELPVGAWFSLFVHKREVVDRAVLGGDMVTRESGYAHTENIRCSALVTLVSLPKPEPALAKPEFAAPPDSELPTYDEIVGALGERWTVCGSAWTQQTPAKARSWEGNDSYYPGPWGCLRSDGPPYLNLQRDDGQRVRFEVPKDWAKTDTLRFLKNVAEDYRSTVPYSSYVRHVRWLPMAESASAKPEPVTLGELKAGEWFEFDGLVECKDVFRVVSSEAGRYVHVENQSGKKEAWLAYRRVRRVPAPQAAFKENSSPVGVSSGTYSWKEAVVKIGDLEHKVSDFTMELTPVDMVRDAMERQLKNSSDAMVRDILRPTDAELFGMVFPRPKSVVRFPDVVPPDPYKRWPNVPADQVPRLERLLAEQVASGGTDCAASRNLLVRRERLIAEERERVKHLEERRAAYRLHGSQHRENRTDDLRSPASGIASLRLEKPLIAYKRRGR